MSSEDGDLGRLPKPASKNAGPADASLVDRLRAGDAEAFAEIVRAWSPMMLRVARSYVSTDASAQEVVQDAWMALVRGLDRFEAVRRYGLGCWPFSAISAGAAPCEKRAPCRGRR